MVILMEDQSKCRVVYLVELNSSMKLLLFIKDLHLWIL